MDAALALYTVFSFAIYSLIPYKTPWSILSSLHAAILLAGFGFHAIVHLARAIPRQEKRLIGAGLRGMSAAALADQPKRSRPR